MATLAQTYIHLKPFNPEGRLSDLADLVERISLRFAREYFRGDPELEVELLEGSLKIRATIVGALTAIALYGDFRGGIDAAVQDSRAFSEHVWRAVVEHAAIPDESVFRVERRLGDVGKIQRLLNKLDALETVDSSEARRAVIEEMRSDLTHLLVSMEERDRRALLEQVPEPIRPPVQPMPLFPLREFAVVPQVPELREPGYIRRRRRVRSDQASELR